VAVGDVRDIRGQNSPSVVRSPVDSNRLVVVNRVDTPSFSCAMHVSADRGKTWLESMLPFPAGEEDPPRCFAPDAAFGADGTLYVSFVTLRGLGNEPGAGWVVSSTDGGSTLSEPSRALGPLSFQARLAADPTRPGRLWLTWLQADGLSTLGFANPGNPILVARSEDGGRSWGAPVRVNPPVRGRVLAPSLAVGGEGRLYLAFLDVGEDKLDYHGAHEGRGGEPYQGRWSLVLARSSDAGQTWSETVVDDQVVPGQRFVSLFPPAPSLALDDVRGRVYVAFADGRSGDADVRVWTSRDDGARFAAPVRVNDTPVGDGTSQHLPGLAVAAGGRLDVVYYDRRSDRDDRMTEVSLQSSGDDGRSFRPRLVLSGRAFDSRVGFGSERGLADLGSRLGLSSTDDGAVAAWADTRAGTEASNKQDVAVVNVAFSSRRRREPLVYAGTAAAVAGLVVAASLLLPKSGTHAS